MLLNQDRNGNWILYRKIKDPYLELDVNRDSKNVYLIDFRGGSGGNFIINCLQLSNFYSHLSKEQKIHHIKNRFNFCIARNKWEDFQIFDFMESDYFNHNHIFLKCHYIHNPTETKKLLNFFNYSKVIQIVNPTLFCSLRGFLTEKYVSIKQFISLENSEKRNILNKIKKIDCLEENYNDRLFYKWDANWYLSEKLTLDNIEKLYKKLSFSDFDRDLIQWYYNNWIDTMDYLWYLS